MQPNLLQLIVSTHALERLMHQPLTFVQPCRAAIRTACRVSQDECLQTGHAHVPAYLPMSLC